MKEEQGNRPLSSDSSLEAEMINYWGRIPDDKDLIDTARHFALWQKEQMMKEAVEGYVNYYEDYGGILTAEAQVGYPYHNGDKVRIIIVKEDNQ